jgi:hypothetical protein
MMQKIFHQIKAKIQEKAVFPPAIAGGNLAFWD